MEQNIVCFIKNFDRENNDSQHLGLSLSIFSTIKNALMVILKKFLKFPTPSGFTFTLTVNPNSPYTLSIDSFGLSTALSRGENSVATTPGDIPYWKQTNIQQCHKYIDELTVILMLDF